MDKKYLITGIVLSNDRPGKPTSSFSKLHRKDAIAISNPLLLNRREFSCTAQILIHSETGEKVINFSFPSDFKEKVANGEIFVDVNQIKSIAKDILNEDAKIARKKLNKHVRTRVFSQK